ncbi:thioredoxin family protein [Tamlana crocina]|uniref:Thioredoxin fold domain-containing protein n=1 Tax=Tamlana crocina TaxID=393006 RepID=A0ABX1DCX5_9FLAO|nr:thioredoxin fold domain-containing protein [Tamlana crocina]NJX16200.1 thioredoxin fold domain-containing protein [Tamlana crocina]
MKKILLLIVAAGFMSLNATAQKINWVSFDEALALQKKNPKKIMVDMYTNWCGPCKMLDKNTFQNPEVADYVNEHYYAVKFNAEGNAVVNYKDKSFTNPNYDQAKANRRNSAHELARYFQISAYPTIVFLDENADVIAPIRGYQTPPKLELYLKMFKKDDHKDIKSQEDFNAYYTAFKPEFKG